MAALISVLLPYRDAGPTLGEAVAGLLACRTPLEILAVDDGSADDGPRWIQALARRDPRVRPVQSDGQGLVAALQRAHAHAQGDLLARMDADDRCDPRRLDLQSAMLRQRPALGALGSRVEVWCADGQPPPEGMQRYVQWQNGLLEPAEHRRELFVEAPLCHPSTMLRRTAFEQVGGYRDTGGPEDYDLWLRLDAAGWQLAKHPAQLLQWRHHPGRATFRDPRYSLEQFRRTKAGFLAARLAEQAAPLVIWGAGQTGKRFARALEAHGMRPAFFVDIDPRKIGRQARGRPIRTREALDPRVHQLVVAVGARGARDLIRGELDRLGFREGERCWFAA